MKNNKEKVVVKTTFGVAGRIRTYEPLSRLPIFKTGAFNQALPQRHMVGFINN